MKRPTRLVIANWKLNPTTLAEAKELFKGIKSAVAKLKKTAVVVCPPAVFLTSLQALNKKKPLTLGIQNVFWAESGSFTGELSPEMVYDLGAHYVLLGHSERRAMGEDNQLVGRKVVAVLKTDLLAVICVGETTRDHHGHYLAFVREQLVTALNKVPKRLLNQVIIAYEPVWAIGKGASEAMNATDVYEMTLFIRKVLSQLYDQPTAFTVPILYGGSVEKDNAKNLMTHSKVNGFLVGHDSLVPKDFKIIVQAVAEAK